jgi:hypothetical protein
MRIPKNLTYVSEAEIEYIDDYGYSAGIKPILGVYAIRGENSN